MNKCLPLVLYDLLDPREHHEANEKPIHRAVNLPFSELPNRMHELPARSGTVRVAAEQPLAWEVVQWLRSEGRQAEIAKEFCYSSHPPDERGRLWSPNAFLEECIEQLTPPGRALDLACGSGRNAVYLKSKGWQVTAIDRLPDALQRGKELEQRYVPEGSDIVWRVEDLESDLPEFEQKFNLITIFFYLHRPLLPRLGDWLVPRGSILIETFTTLHRSWHGRPASDAFVLQPSELPNLVNGFSILHFSEDWHGNRHTARLFAQSK